ncbi:hypothetical protein JL09_g6197 [Pichia kudriavzevii]|uniref:Uncharacterized protein n=1 Tax=Pichia kudriavzevii TaxID=4909 RepID=A0A099NRF8_PICKU|nr:hypothetical protein JL09_g6197 [Pichia kudriavzevii]
MTTIKVNAILNIVDFVIY